MGASSALLLLINSNSGVTYNVSTSLTTSPDIFALLNQKHSVSLSLPSATSTSINGTKDSAALCDIVSVSVYEPSSTFIIDVANTNITTNNLTFTSQIDHYKNVWVDTHASTLSGSNIDAAGVMFIDSHPTVADSAAATYNLLGTFATQLTDLIENSLNANALASFTTSAYMYFNASIEARPSIRMATNGSLLVKNQNIMNNDFSVYTYSDYSYLGGKETNHDTPLTSIGSLSMNPGLVASNFQANESVSNTTISNNMSISGINLYNAHPAEFISSNLLMSCNLGIQTFPIISAQNINLMDTNASYEVKSEFIDQNINIINDNIFYSSTSECLSSSVASMYCDTDVTSSVRFSLDLYWLFYRLPFRGDTDRTIAESEVSICQIGSILTKDYYQSDVTQNNQTARVSQLVSLKGSLHRAKMSAGLSRNKFVSVTSSGTMYNAAINRINAFAGATTHEEFLSFQVKTENDAKVIKIILEGKLKWIT